MMAITQATMMILKPVLRIALALLLASSFSFAAEEWKTDMPCGKKLPEFVETKNQGCAQSFCSSQFEGRSVCACLPSTDNAVAHITYKNNHATIKEWDMEWMPSYFTAQALRQDAVDIDGDGKPEIVLAMMPWASQGMGVETWNLVVLDGDNVSAPLTTEDYGTMSYFLCPKNSRRAMLLLAQWQGGWEPSAGGGMYVTARWYQFEKSADNAPVTFAATTDRPNIYHRYLRSLESRRSDAMSEKPVPVLWYRNQQAKPVIGPYTLH